MTPSPPVLIRYRRLIAELYPRRRLLKLAALACSLALAALFLVLKLGFGDTYRNIVQEDEPLENAQAVACLAAAVISFSVMTSFARRRQTLHTLQSFALTAALALICLEEVSWGQRALSLPTPNYFQTHNTQNELTLHNLDWVNHLLPEVYMLVGLLCSFGWLAARRMNGPRGAAGAGYFVPDWYLTFYFLPVVAVYSYFEFGGLAGALGVNPEYLRVGYFVIWRDQEPAELLLSLGLLLFAVRNKLRQDLDASGVVDANSHTRAVEQVNA